MKKNILLTTFFAGISICGQMYAQDTGFDLDSQRGESRELLKVPGKVIDHQGIVINPTPQHLSVTGEGALDISGGVRVKDRKGGFAQDIDFLNTGGRQVILDIDYGKKASAKYNVSPIPGAYFLRTDAKGITIAGYDDAGAFYGLQTLRQIVKDGKVPFVEISDYPDLPYRGVVEGFYGTPWSHEVRMSLIDFYGRNKMNTYLYGPKDDPYHSCPDWRLPYPEDEAEDIRELVLACKRNRVDFVWAIHPGQDIKWNEEDYRNLVNKFEIMYGLGVRSFAIFFDDISGEGTDPVKQTGLLNRLNEEFVKAKGDVSSLIMCPTDYSRLWADPAPDGDLAIYGRLLDPSIDIFWTGDVVCSDMTPETLEWVNSRIKRPALYWWNYPVTDYVRHILMQGPVYGLDTGLTSEETAGLVSNPMEHGEASKLALYGVADYSWNIKGYNAIDNWERGLTELAGSARDAYRTFAIHSCDTETGYRRDESWETVTFPVSGYTEEKYDALLSEFCKIEKVPEELEAGCENEALLKELRPWLAEFGKLGTRGRKSLELIKLSKSNDEAEFWSSYVKNIMSDEDRSDYSAHKSGTLKLQPFYETTMDDLGAAFFMAIAGERSSFVKSVGSFGNASTILGKLMTDNDSTTYYTSGVSQSSGDWIGVDLGSVIPVTEISILQGRNSTDDVDYFDHARLEYSADGKNWTALIDDMVKQYVIGWTGEPVQARYVRLLRLDSEKTNWAAIRTFDVNPADPSKYGFSVCSDDMEKAVRAFDRNAGTSYKLNGTVSSGLPEEAKTIIILSGIPAGKEAAVLNLYAEDGTPLSSITLDRPFIKTDIDSTAANFSISGNTELFEIICR